VCEAELQEEGGTGGVLKSKEVGDLYSSDEPQFEFNRRTLFCLDLYNQAVKALRFPQKTSYSDDMESLNVNWWFVADYKKCVFYYSTDVLFFSHRRNGSANSKNWSWPKKWPMMTRIIVELKMVTYIIDFWFITVFGFVFSKA